MSTIENQAGTHVHKGLRIGPFIIALICLALIVLLFAGGGAMSNAWKASPELSMIIGFGLWPAASAIVGIALGIAGAVDRLSRKAPVVIGQA